MLISLKTVFYSFLLGSSLSRDKTMIVQMFERADNPEPMANLMLKLKPMPYLFLRSLSTQLFEVGCCP